MGSQPLLWICLISGSAEYNSHESLSEFQRYLEKNYHIACVQVFGEEKDMDLPGLEALDTCDLMVLFTRRMEPPPKQLEKIKAYCRAGKPVIALRTASHAFQNWLAFDREVLGGDYQNHYGEGITQVSIAESAKGHPVLDGVVPFSTVGSLYKNPALAPDVQVLLIGTSPKGTEPVAWTRLHNGGRIFYTSLGHPEDFKNESFRRMLVSAVFWAAGRKAAAKESP